MFIEKETGRILDIIEVDCVEPPMKEGKIHMYDIASNLVYRKTDYSGFVYNINSGIRKYNDDPYNLPDDYTNIAPSHIGQSFDKKTKKWSLNLECLKKQKKKEINECYEQKLLELKETQIDGLIEFWTIIESEINLFNKRKREKEVPFLLELSKHSKSSIAVLVHELSESMQELKTQLAFLMGKRQAYYSTIDNTIENNDMSVRTLMTLIWK